MNQIISPLNQGMQGPPVADLQEALLFLIDRNIIKTFSPPNQPGEDELRRLSLELNREHERFTFGNGTRQLVHYFQNQQGLSDRFNGSIETKTALALNRLLTELGAFETSNINIVKGTIYDAFNAPISHAIVLAIDKDLRLEQIVGQTVTDASGSYIIRYNAAIYADSEYKMADIFIRILNDTGVVLGESDIYFNVPNTFTIDFKIDRSPVLMPNEFEALLKKITPILNSQHVAMVDIQENERFKDITFLTKETGEDFSKITLLPIAFILSEKTRIAPDIFYGLFRLNFPTQLDGLLLIKSESISDGIQSAINGNIISAKFTDQIDSTLAIFNQFASGTVLSGSDTQSSAFKQVIGAAIPQPDLQQTFVSTYLANEKTPEKFWDALSLQPEFSNPDIITSIKSVLKLDLLTNHVPSLSTLLFNEQQQNPALNDLRGFASFSFNDWHQRIDQLVASGALTEFPQGTKGNTPDEKSINYANSLSELIKELYPASVFTGELNKDTRNVFGEAKTDVKTFLTNNEDFDLKTNYFNKAFEASNLSGIGNKESLKKELTGINRLYKIAGEYKYVSALMLDGIESATALVSKYSPAQFSEKYSTSLTADAASKIYKNAQKADNLSAAVALSLKMRNDIPIYAINGPTNEVDSDYISMFGDTNCDCEHCQSVYSPAAYFTDILNVTKKYNELAFTRITTRRPDLQEILLTCKNTNTPLPYIDLVNQLLENIIVPIPPVVVNGVPTYPHFQSNNSAEELLAFPEHVNAAAYAQLKTADSDYALPLHLPLEETRLYLEKMGTERSLLMELFYGKKTVSRYNDLSIAIEYLQLSQEELNLVNGTTPRPVSLGMMSDFLEETSLTYIEALQLLECYFINPLVSGERGIKIVSITDNQASCKIEDLKLQSAEPDSLKIKPFIRLWKKFGWNILDLDRVFMALGLSDYSGDTNTRLILPLSHIARVKADLNLSIQNIVSFWVNIDTHAYHVHSADGQPEIPSQYDSFFRNKRISNPTDTHFNDPLTLNGTLAAKSGLIMSAFNLSQKDFEVVNQASIVDGQLNLDNLTILFRYATLSKALKLSVPDLINCIDITGVHPFGNIAQTIDILIFIDKVTSVRSSGFAVSGLVAILSKSYIQKDDVTNISRQLLALREGLKKIEEMEPVGTTPQEQADNKLKSQNSFISDTMATAFKTESKVADILLNKLVKSVANSSQPGITPFIDTNFITREGPLFTTDASNNIVWIFPDVYDTYVLLGNTFNRISVLLAKLKITSDEFIYFQKYENSLKLDGLWNLPASLTGSQLFPAFENLVHIVRFRNVIIAATTEWYKLFDPPLLNDTNAKKNFIEALALQSNNKVTDLEFLLGLQNDISNTGYFGYTFPDDYLKGEALLNVILCARVCSKLGAAPEVVAGLINPLPDENTSALAGSLLKSKYDVPTWLSIIQPISNRLRIKKRDALVRYILTSPETTMSDFRQTNQISGINSLYSYFLIDPEMDPCMLTSRIKQAISSVQLFVDRCLMNLEEGIVLDNEFSTQWNTWRKRYRVWEANRKVFLYPENWIEPELRDDKTPFFKDIESKLRQMDITEETAEEALREYLEKLDTVANLEMVGVFNDPLTGMVHAIGRTRNVPHRFFYIRQNKSIWSAWEKIDLDIEGDHILPVVWNNRLLLFWCIFSEKQEESGGGSTINPEQNGSSTISTTSAAKYFEIKLAWSEYKNGKWSAKKQSRETVSTLNKIVNSLNQVNKNVDKNQIQLTSTFVDGKLHIKFFAWADPYRKYFDKQKLDGFYFENCNGSPKILLNNEIPTEYFEIMNNANNLGMFLWEKEAVYKSPAGDDTLSVFNSGLSKFHLDANSNVKLFDKTPGTFQILPNHHNIPVTGYVPFFYSNEHHNFYVQSSGSYRRPHFEDITVLTEGVLISRKALKPFRETGIALANGFVGITDVEVDISSVNELTSDFPVHPKIFFGKKYSFQSFYYPYICDFTNILNTSGIEGFYKKTVLDIDNVYKDGIQNTIAREIFNGSYNPTQAVKTPYPVEQVDFNYSGVFSSYNWELFFHIPLLIAVRLSQNQKFEEARKWFHYIFDPTRSSTPEITGIEKFWIPKPFKDEIKKEKLPVEDLLNSASPDLNLQLDNWERNPFNPHSVARLRVSSYMRTTVMKYIDNLINWGDQLFRQNTLETINEATLLYMEAANLLGKKPERIPARAIPEENSFSTIQGKLDNFSNVKVLIQSWFSLSDENDGDTVDSVIIPLFCIPKNDILLGYWNKVADRLFKIRHCQNIEGVVQQLPLFEPPLDPGLLIRANAAGIDLNTLAGELNFSLPGYRFQVMLQKAYEFCSDLRSLSSEFLSALEKNDAEHLSLLRSGHEMNMLAAIRDIKQMQVNEAQRNLESLNESRKVVQLRRDYYGSRSFTNAAEQQYLNQTRAAAFYQELASAGELMTSISYLLPEFKLGSGFTIGSTFGGNNIGNKLSAATRSLSTIANIYTLEASQANTIGGYQRRQDDWKFQTQTADVELKQIDKLITAAEIRLAIAEKEIDNHDLQMQHSHEVDDFLRSKFTSEDLYNYMIGQLSTVYFQSYQLAFNMAKKAEKCFQHELGVENSSFISFGYWDSLKKGLLSGEKMQHDLRRMENAFLEQNTREYEITRHISISLLDPLALVKLRSTGNCEFNLPEVLFDIDYPGQYFRRIKSVSISIPCIVGPYTSVGAKLSLLNSRYRKNMNADNSASTGYQEDPGNDERFVYKFGVLQSIAASSSQRDSGTFELNFRDERYLPFEGSGAISSWSLELPSEIAMFDFNTISDVILHISYTSREGGTELKNLSNATIKTQLATIKQQLSQEGIIYSINVKNDKPNDWHLLKKNGSVDIVIDKSSLPYFLQPLAIEITKVMFIARLNTSPSNITISINGTDLEMQRNEEWKIYTGTRDDVGFNSSFRITIPSSIPLNDLQEILFVLNLGLM